MKRSFFASLLFLGLIAAGRDAMAGPINVALGKTVTLNGVFFTGGWGSGLTAAPEVAVDGVFFPQNTQWDQGPIWWDSTGSDTGQNIVVDLGGTFTIDSVIVQADDNDAYILSYWDAGTSSWQVAWNVPTAYNYGMQTRPNPTNDNERYILPSPITTTALKIEGNLPESDGLFGVGEIQAFTGGAVPEPATLALLGGGLAMLLGLRRKKS
jgi:hypothetical protein